MKKTLFLFALLAAQGFSQPLLIPFTPDTTNEFSPTLTWNPVAGANTYRIQVDDAADFASPLVTRLVTGATSYRAMDLPPGRRYWHVSSEPDLDTYSAADDFLITPAPVLIHYTPNPTPARRLTFRWNFVPGADDYKIEIDDQEDFSSPIVSQHWGWWTYYQPSEDLPAGDIYWRVSSSFDYAYFSPTDKITIDTTLDYAPVLIPYAPDPTNDDRPILSWKPVAGTDTYRVQVDDAADFATPLYTSLITGATSWRSYALSGRNYWRVSSGLELDYYSSPDDFLVVTYPVLIPYAPDPTSARRPSLKWNSVPGASNYKVEIDDQDSFASPILSQNAGDSLSFKPGQDLPVGDIHWRVSSNIDFAAFSPPDKFVIDTTVPRILVLIPYSPDPTYVNTPTLTWHDLEGASQYRIQVDDQADFASPLIVDQFTGATSFTTIPLENGPKYWHVSGDFDYTAFSATDTFTVTCCSATKPRPATQLMVFGQRSLRVPAEAHQGVLKIFGATGKLLLTRGFNRAPLPEWDLSKLREGAYFVQIRWQDVAGRPLARVNSNFVHFAY